VQKKREETNLSHLGWNCRTKSIVHFIFIQHSQQKCLLVNYLCIKTPLPIADFIDILMWYSVL